MFTYITSIVDKRKIVMNCKIVIKCQNFVLLTIWGAICVKFYRLKGCLLTSRCLANLQLILSVVCCVYGGSS